MRMLKKQVLFQDKEKTFSVLLADSRWCFFGTNYLVEKSFLAEWGTKKKPFCCPKFCRFSIFCQDIHPCLGRRVFCIWEENENYLCRLFWRTTCFFLLEFAFVFVVLEKIKKEMICADFLGGQLVLQSGIKRDLTHTVGNSLRRWVPQWQCPTNLKLSNMVLNNNF